MATFVGSMSWLFRLFVLYFTAVVAAPAAVYVAWELRRDHIMRELCVQRDVVDGMRTCHGECVLAKRYKALEREAQEGFPAERVVRFEPVTELDEERSMIVLPVQRIHWTEPGAWTLDGFGDAVDHVPKG